MRILHFGLAAGVFIACDGGNNTPDIKSEYFEDNDGDGYISAEDCNDFDPTIHPNADEVCDGKDNNCNGISDEDVEQEFYGDADQDGFGNVDLTIAGCEIPNGFVENGDDCDDTNADVYPNAIEQCDNQDNDCDGYIDEDDSEDATTWYADNDEDGFGDPNNTTQACTQPTGYMINSDDCDDADPTRSPDFDEYCNGIDDNCNGVTDENESVDAIIWYADNDEDGFGDFNNTIFACSLIEGYVDNFDDCDDIDSNVSPSATEYCNDLDDDCDGVIDEGDATGASTWYADNDGDGFGDLNNLTQACTQPTGYVVDMADCDDADDDTFPQAPEVCDGEDNNCDGAIDEGVGLLWYADGDLDGFGDADTTMQQCTQPAGYVGNNFDCDDNYGNISPTSDEYCNGIDDNCNGVTDENTAVDALAWYLDHDSDGYGDITYTQEACTEPFGYVATNDDCNDTDASVYPNATETCDDIDHNCDGTIDFDIDGDGFSSDTCGGSDCVDNDPTIFPDAFGACYYCGDGILSGTESCDDGDVLDSDGCSATCQVEPNSECVGVPSTCTVDATPDGFAFVDVVDELNVDVISDPILLAGFIGSLTATLSGDPSAVILLNGVDVGTSTTVIEGDEIEIAIRSGQGHGDIVSATLDIGGETATWNVTSSDDGFFQSFADVDGGRPRHVLATSDGGWLISGEVGATDFQKGYALKVDSTFTKEWDLVIDYRQLFYLEYARENTDGSFTLAGLDYNGTTDASTVFVNISDVGTLLSTENATSSSEDWCNNPMELDDGGLLCIGADSTNGISRRMLVRRWNANLVADWSYTMGHPTDWSWFGARTQLSNGDIVLGGTFRDYFANASGGYHTHLTRLTSSATILETKYDSSIVTHGATDLTAYPDGGAMMLSFFGTVVTRLDSNLEEVWSWSISDANLWKQVVLDDGNIMIFGTSATVGAGGQDIVMMKIDEDGNILDSATLGSIEEDNVVLAQSIGNQELLLGGTTRGIAPSVNAGFILRMGEDFELSSCTPLTLQPWSPQIGTFAYSFGATSAFNSPKTTSTGTVSLNELTVSTTSPASCTTPF